MPSRPLPWAICLVWGAIASAPLAIAQSVGPPVPLLITISKPDCSRLVRHFPAPDVAYRPGVDTRGRPVVGADLDPVAADFARRVVPDTLQIEIKLNPLTFNQARRPDSSGPSGYARGLEQSQATIGVVAYDFSRETFTYNGEPMMLDDQRQLAAACARKGAR